MRDRFNAYVKERHNYTTEMCVRLFCARIQLHIHWRFDFLNLFNWILRRIVVAFQHTLDSIRNINSSHGINERDNIVLHATKKKWITPNQTENCCWFYVWKSQWNDEHLMQFVHCHWHCTHETITQHLKRQMKKKTKKKIMSGYLCFVFTLPKNRNRWYFVLFLSSYSTCGISFHVSSVLLVIFNYFTDLLNGRKKKTKKNSFSLNSNTRSLQEICNAIFSISFFCWKITIIFISFIFDSTRILQQINYLIKKKILNKNDSTPNFKTKLWDTSLERDSNMIWWVQCKPFECATVEHFLNSPIYTHISMHAQTHTHRNRMEAMVLKRHLRSSTITNGELMWSWHSLSTAG